jgi:type I restriction enzyme S subunit
MSFAIWMQALDLVLDPQVLPSLTTTSAQIKQLRQTILNLAVRGKLVEQDPEDEPAGELLEKAAADISNYQTQFNIRSHKTQERTETASTFSLPQGWQWTQPFRIFRSITDGDHQAPPRSPEGIPFLVIGDVRDRSINYEADRFVPETYYDLISIERKPVKGDLLYTLVGSYGIPVIVKENTPFCVQRHIGILRPSSFASVEFLALLMDSTLVYEQVSNIATGIAQKTVPLGGLRKLLIPLPPLAEQHRIVAKVDELMALCDQLEQQLSQADQQSRRLLEAVLAVALGGRLPTGQEESHAAIA